MRPYLAIIKDSFHEARASKLFWLLIAASTLLLVALVPFGFDEAKGSFHYAGNELPKIFSAFGKEQALQQAVGIIITWILGMVGLWLAILVTAGFIPNTFQEGSIDLLLSKPVSRPALFLAKFSGGCTFYFFNVLYLASGLFLLLGARFSYWEPKLLYCTLLSLFVFVIYYSISSITGLIWKNTIVCVILTLVFWGSCKAVEYTNWGFDEFGYDPIVGIIPTKNGMIVKTRSRECRVWNATDKKWMMVDTQFMTYGSTTQFSKATDTLYWFDIERNTLSTASEETQWNYTDLEVKVPEGMKEIIVNARGELIGLSLSGIYSFKNNSFTLMTDLKGILDQEDHGDYYAMQTHIDEATGNLFLTCSGQIHRFEPSKQTYVLRKTETLSWLPHGRQLMTSCNGYLYVTGSNHTLVLYDFELTVKKTIQYGLNPIVSMQPYKDGIVVLLAESNKLMSCDASSAMLKEIDIDAQGDITGFKVADGKLWLAENRINVIQYDLDKLEEEEAYNTPLTGIQKFHKMVVIPIYNILPKPAQLDTLMTEVLNDEKNEEKTVKAAINWAPLWSNLGFVFVMLSFGCFYVSKKDY